MKLKHFLTPYTKINSKWIKNLNEGPETIKLLEENIGKTLSDINHSRILYDPPPRILEIKAKINKWDLIKEHALNIALQLVDSVCVCVKSLQFVQLCATSWTAASQASLSMEFSRQEYWSGLPFPSPGDFPDPGMEPRSPSLQADSLPSELSGKPHLLLHSSPNPLNLKHQE